MNLVEKTHEELVTALVANADGEIFELEGYAAVGMSGPKLTTLSLENTIEMPYGGELMFLPDRAPILYNLETGEFEVVIENPYEPGEPLYPVAAFNSPGYVISYSCAYEEEEEAGFLPLFSYGAVGWKEGAFMSAVFLVDSEKRQDLRLMPEDKIVEGVERTRPAMPENRLLEHIENCALVYGCPAAKNFFLERFEAPLPTSRICNARCIGCISLQEEETLSSCQNRIDFTPTPEEIAQIALKHILKVDKSVVSFGQGCEGDPLFAADVIEPALKIIRSETDRGTINMNTNASRPDILERLFNAGLDSIRVSMNSARKSCYHAYFRPKGYTFDDVKKSIDLAGRMGRHVALNYLNCPGVTDSPEEIRAFNDFLGKHKVNLIQWRNLNFDPMRYWETMNEVSPMSEAVGMETLTGRLKKRFPDLKHGYFNPPKENFKK